MSPFGVEKASPKQTLNHDDDDDDKSDGHFRDDNYDDVEEDEHVGLIRGNNESLDKLSGHDPTATTTTTSQQSKRKISIRNRVRQLFWMTSSRWKLLTAIAAVCSLPAVVHWDFGILSRSKSSSSATTQQFQRLGTTYYDEDGIMHYPCPHDPNKNKKDSSANDEDSKRYNEESSKIKTRDNSLKEFLRSFRHTEYDNWGHTYEEVKAGMHDWKKRYFVEN
jgi:hypothetical protein